MITLAMNPIKNIAPMAAPSRARNEVRLIFAPQCGQKSAFLLSWLPQSLHGLKFRLAEAVLTGGAIRTIGGSCKGLLQLEQFTTVPESLRSYSTSSLQVGHTHFASIVCLNDSAAESKGKPLPRLLRRAEAIPGGRGIGTSVARAAGAQSWGQ